MRNLSKQSFITSINALKDAKSVTGKTYHSFYIDDTKVHFKREGKTKHEAINLEELYKLYKAIDKPTNQQARSYISGRVQSPAVSIINAIGSNKKSISNSDKFNKNEKRDQLLQEKKASKNHHKTSQKDESLFFEALSNLIGQDYFQSKSIGKPITSTHAFLSDDYREYGFPEAAIQSIENLLNTLQSNKSFKGGSLSHHIDGLLFNHPKLGTRIIEFDEEQHFTPALRFAIESLHKNFNLSFIKHYKSILEDLNYLNYEVLKKNRIKLRYSSYPKNFNQFLIDIKDEKETGYIKVKENGFPYLGGRIAQRAYYDCLRNVAHLSPKNTGFKPIIRFPKKYFENEAKMKFKSIDIEMLKKLILKYLKNIYEYKL